MKKLLSTLFISFFGLVSFWYCLSPSYSYSSVSNYSTITNEYPNSDTFLCFDSYEVSQYNFNDFIIRDSDYYDIFNLNGNWVKFNKGFICALIPSGTSRFFVSRSESSRQLSSITLYQFELGSDEPSIPSQCDEAVCNVIVYDSFNMMSSNTQYWVEPWGIQDIRFTYDSAVSSYQVYGTSSSPNYSFSPSSSLINCGNSLSSCQASLSNAVCESHIQFQDISNGTWVKTLSSYFSPFSWANNNSVYYDSQENVVQVDNQNWVAEVISAVPSIPPEPCDCSEAISWAVASCNSQLSSLSWNYNSCLSELNSCMAWGYNTWDLTRSALYINQIQHLGKPIIRINIPEEISRDYSNTWDSFDLDINGYNVDTEYVDNIIKIQNYKPTTEDFTKLVGLFGKFWGLLVSCLLVIIIFALIRKMFK